MAVTRYRDWSIFSKIMMISVINVVIFTFVVVGYWAPLMGKTLLSGKRGATRQAVEVAFGVLQSWQGEVARGRIPLEEAKQRAAAQIRGLRYSGSEYFWINDLEGRMVLHPSRPELEGRNLIEERDAAGKYLFKEFIRAAKENGAGEVDYQWPKPGRSEPVPKTSYVKLFTPWGWVLGSGVYIDDVTSEIHALYWKLGGGFVFFSLITLLLALSIGRGVSRPLRSMVARLPEISAGNLTCRLQVEQKNEIGMLAEAFNLMLEKLSSMVAEIKQSTDSIASSSTVLSNESERMAGGAEQTAEKSTIVAMASEEMSATSDEIARSCSRAAESSNKASALASTGTSIVEATVTGMEVIAGQVRRCAAAMESLGARSDQIGEIVNTIGDIADQTNLLALNAAIEAARAGDQGRGFAVVADEVRALADRTASATKEISGMIKVIQKETRDAVCFMETGVHEVEQGTRDAARSGEALREITEQINDVTIQISQIASAAEGQCSTIGDITQIIQQITGVIQETSSGSHESAQAAARITGLSEELRRQVGQFHLNGSFA